MLFSTARIVAKRSDGKAANGTAFFLQFKFDEIRNIPVLITNKRLTSKTLGYPIGLWGSVNNLPLFRRGITAPHAAIDFEREAVGLLDIATFPGSSDSPVMLLNKGSYSHQGGLTVGSGIVLLGILYQYYYVGDKGCQRQQTSP